MDLNKDSSEYEQLVDSSGKVVIFAKIAEWVSEDPWLRGNIFKNEYYRYNYSPKWEDLVKQIQATVIAVFEDYFCQNNWLQHGFSIIDDIAGIFEGGNLLQQMTESLDATIAELAELYSRTLSIADIPNICGFDFEFFISPSKVNKFLRDHMLIYSIDSENGIYIVLDLPHDEPQKLVTTAMEELLQRMPAVIPQWLLWTKMPNTLQSLSINTLDLPKMFPSCSRHLQFLRVYWITNQNELDQNVSFGADVLPTLQTLVISSLDCISDFRAFHDVLSRSTISSSLSCIQIQYLPSSHQMEEQSWRVLDDTLVQLPDHVQIKLEDKYWQFLPQLQSKAMPWDVPTLPFSE
ncbi:hypothetical protein ABKN59_000640 [Abortiporus biennis]